MKRGSTVVIALLLSLGILQAQTGTTSASISSDAAWQQVGTISQRKDLRIKWRDGSEYRGRIERWAPNGFTVNRYGQAEWVAKADIARISTKSRAKGALIGAIVGAGVGFAQGCFEAGHLLDINNPTGGQRVQVGAAFGAIFGGIGAGFGALVGMQKTVYRAQK